MNTHDRFMRNVELFDIHLARHRELADFYHNMFMNNLIAFLLCRGYMKRIKQESDRHLELAGMYNDCLRLPHHNYNCRNP